MKKIILTLCLILTIQPVFAHGRYYHYSPPTYSDGYNKGYSDAKAQVRHDIINITLAAAVVYLILSNSHSERTTGDRGYDQYLNRVYEND